MRPSGAQLTAVGWRRPVTSGRSSNPAGSSLAARAAAGALPAAAATTSKPGRDQPQHDRREFSVPPPARAPWAASRAQERAVPRGRNGPQQGQPEAGCERDVDPDDLRRKLELILQPAPTIPCAASSTHVSVERAPAPSGSAPRLRNRNQTATAATPSTLAMRACWWIARSSVAGTLPLETIDLVTGAGTARVRARGGRRQCPRGSSAHPAAASARNDQTASLSVCSRSLSQFPNAHAMPVWRRRSG